MGRVTVVGGKGDMTKPGLGLVAGELATGTSVYLMHNGDVEEYMVVNQGIPSNSSLYDTSCDGTWLLQKNAYDVEEFVSDYGNRDNNLYRKSDIHANLNSAFFNLFGPVEQQAIKQVKIPCDDTTVIAAGGLDAKVFLLSMIELGFTSSMSAGIPSNDGAALSYFKGAGSKNTKRIAKNRIGTAVAWWSRSPGNVANQTSSVYYVTNEGGYHSLNVYDDSQSNTSGIRPAVILPKTAYFDETTRILKGVR